MTNEPDEPSVVAEAMIVTGMAVLVGAGLFEWLVISPNHPGHALLRVLGSGLAATTVTALVAWR
ncbi:hypothetical protein [Methylobacterium sp. J-076]|uniref:hypothetical protein n=1 Tax=Methylobacterium sp. J-076 TaxID=2836655 RepID=UPI001FBAC282|nr:hypothetical protein [Methylobacterium sp. J-076]MCJ2015710.1 hypothetical protein [Methylobacterium sp. J-076]